jgi:hypothetical protein
MKLTTNSQKENFKKGLKAAPLIREVSVKGRTNNISKEPNMATTPSSLLGIDRKIV